jgi:signal peptidase I
MCTTNDPLGRIKIWLVIGVLAALMGCVGYVRGGYYGDRVVVPDPDLYLFGGIYNDGPDAHHYSHRGHESRSAAHVNARHGGKR